MTPTQKRLEGLKKFYYGDLSEIEYFTTIIEPLILKGYTANSMYKENLTTISGPTIRKLTLLYASEQTLKKFEDNIKVNKGTGGRNSKNRISKLKGRKYEDILGIDRALKKKKQSSDRLKAINPRIFSKKISKGQQLLFELIKDKFPTAVLEYKVVIERNYFLDIAVPELKLNFEYDGTYWHSSDEAKKRDLERDEKLNQLGWKIFRFKLDCPTIDKLKELIKKYDT